MIAKVSAHISRGLIAGVCYEGDIIPGIAGAHIPIVVRRKPSMRAVAIVTKAESLAFSGKAIMPGSFMGITGLR